MQSGRFLACVLLATSTPSVALGQSVGDRVHLTSCVTGQDELVPLAVWDSPSGRSRRVQGFVGVGRASDAGRCNGSVVIIRAQRSPKTTSIA